MTKQFLFFFALDYTTWHYFELSKIFELCDNSFYILCTHKAYWQSSREKCHALEWTFQKFKPKGYIYGNLLVQ